MDKCREAFEKTPDIAKRISNGVYFNENLKIYREIKGSCRGATFVNGAWCVWQSRQSEFDAITEALLNQTQLLAKKQAEVDEANAKSQMCRDEKTHAINRWSQIRKEVEEKDKRIEALIAQIEMSDFKDSLGHKLKSNLAYLDLKALRGEHEA